MKPLESGGSQPPYACYSLSPGLIPAASVGQDLHYCANDRSPSRIRHFPPRFPAGSGWLRPRGRFHMSKWHRRIGIRRRDFRLVDCTVAVDVPIRHSLSGALFTIRVQSLTYFIVRLKPDLVRL